MRYSGNAPVKLTKTIDGRAFEVEISDAGEFKTFYKGAWLTASTLKALMEKIRKDMRSEGRVMVPLTRIEEDHWRRGREQITVSQVVVMGVHASNNNVLYRDEKTNETEQERGSTYFYRRLTGPEIEEAVKIYREMKRTERAWEAWKEKNRVDARDLYVEAQERLAQSDQPAEPLA